VGRGAGGRRAPCAMRCAGTARSLRAAQVVAAAGKHMPAPLPRPGALGACCAAVCHLGARCCARGGAGPHRTRRPHPPPSRPPRFATTCTTRRSWARTRGGRSCRRTTRKRVVRGAGGGARGGAVRAVREGGMEGGAPRPRGVERRSVARVPRACRTLLGAPPIASARNRSQAAARPATTPAGAGRAPRRGPTRTGGDGAARAAVAAGALHRLACSAGTSQALAGGAGPRRGRRARSPDRRGSTSAGQPRGRRAGLSRGRQATALPQWRARSNRSSASQVGAVQPPATRPLPCTASTSPRRGAKPLARQRGIPAPPTRATTAAGPAPAPHRPSLPPAGTPFMVDGFRFAPDPAKEPRVVHFLTHFHR
jgi:hypothetical protein